MTQFKQGDKVLVIGDGTIYTIESIDCFSAKLSYQSAKGKPVNGGIVDTSLLIGDHNDN